MKHWAILIVALVFFWAGCATNSSTPAAEQHDVAWAIKADYADCCCCQPACPCIFGSAPTMGHCDGATLVEIEEGHFHGTRLDGIKVVAVYRGAKWIKFFVSDTADKDQTEAVLKLLPTMEEFFAVDNVLEVKNVPVTVSRSEEQVCFSVPGTAVEIELMKGAGGRPIKIQGLPAPGFPGPPFLDFTQYRSLELSHERGEQQFSYSGTNGFTTRIEAVAP